MRLEEINSAAGLQNSATSASSRRAGDVDVQFKKRGVADKATSDRLETSGANGQVEVTAGQTELSKSDIEEALSKLREYSGWGNFNIDFAQDDESGSTVIKIIDRDTGDTIRQIPPDQVIRLKTQLKETLGLIFDHLA